MNAMMRREIEAQAEFLPRLQPVLAAAADGLPRATGRILAGGCGDSAFAPRALRDVFDRLGVEIEARTSMDLAGFTRYRAGDTVILSSISGGTKRTVEAVRVARAHGASVVAVTCNADSALAAAGDAVMVLPYAPLSRKTPHTLDYTVTLLALSEIARSMAGHPAELLSLHEGELRAMLRSSEAKGQKASASYRAGAKVFFLGAGGDFGTAEYAAAKFHEAGGLATIAAETENFVHGMNFMLDADDLLVALASTPAGERRGRQVVDAFGPIATTDLLVANAGSNDAASAFRRVLELTATAQFMCLHVADAEGLRVEEPRAGRERGPEHLRAQSQAMSE